jgi:hypothetical protein
MAKANKQAHQACEKRGQGRQDDAGAHATRARAAVDPGAGLYDMQAACGRLPNGTVSEPDTAE